MNKTAYTTIGQLKKAIDGIITVEHSTVEINDETKLRDTLIDNLIYTAVFSPEGDIKAATQWLIGRTGYALGIFCASIQPLYEKMGTGEISGFTVPAINLRGITYHSAQAVFRAALKGAVGVPVFEIARSEIGYTQQRPSEYTAAVTAAAIKSGYSGPLFLQGDHFQINAKKYNENPQAEIEAARELIKEAVQNGFYNIDIDASTLVDLSKPSIQEQQENNYGVTADLTAFIRAIEPEGITVSIGGEIGEVGKTNTTVEEFRVFMDNYLEALKTQGKELKGISKISIQTGTTHGGVPLPDGSIAQVKIDFATLRNISRTARDTYGLAGAVQHGASTLPEEVFNTFPETGTAEVHLATGFQNIIYDSRSFPAELRDKIYFYLNTELSGEKKEGDTAEQFIYKTRKKGFGPFKHELWNLPDETLDAIGAELEQQFFFLFKKLNTLKTREIVTETVKAVDVPIEIPAVLRA